MKREFCDVCGKEVFCDKATLTLRLPYEADIKYIDDDESAWTSTIKYHTRRIVLCDRCGKEAESAIFYWGANKRVFTKGQYAVIERAVKEQEQ